LTERITQKRKEEASLFWFRLFGQSRVRVGCSIGKKTAKREGAQGTVFIICRGGRTHGEGEKKKRRQAPSAAMVVGPKRKWERRPPAAAHIPAMLSLIGKSRANIGNLRGKRKRVSKGNCNAV